MIKGTTIAAAVFGSVLLGAAGSAAGAVSLFNKVIPRQKQLRVNLDEFADMKKWEEYKKIISPRKEWLINQNPEKITVTARDGIKLHAFYLPAENPSGKIIIGHHGYTSCGQSDYAYHSSFFHEQGFDVLVPDHRGHGESEGDYIGFGILDRYDSLEWIRYVRRRFGEDKEILLHGTSMGGTTVLMASGFDEVQKNVKGIIADCAFTSPFDIFSHILKRDYHLPPFPVMNINDAICRRKAGYGFRDYSTLTALKTNKIPVLFIHGKGDKFVPTWMTKSNYDACTAEKDILWVENAGHGSSCYENTEAYEQAEKKFIYKYFTKGTQNI